MKNELFHDFTRSFLRRNSIIGKYSDIFKAFDADGLIYPTKFCELGLRLVEACLYQRDCFFYTFLIQLLNLFLNCKGIPRYPSNHDAHPMRQGFNRLKCASLDAHVLQTGGSVKNAKKKCASDAHFLASAFLGIF